MMGSGWPSGHVAIDRYYMWPDNAGGGEICLTSDAENFDEFSHNIDEFITELEAIRLEAPKRFSQWKAEYESAEK